MHGGSLFYGSLLHCFFAFMVFAGGVTASLARKSIWDLCCGGICFCWVYGDRYPGSFMAWARPMEMAGQSVFEMRRRKLLTLEAHRETHERFTEHAITPDSAWNSQVIKIPCLNRARIRCRFYHLNLRLRTQKENNSIIGVHLAWHSHIFLCRTERKF